MQKIDLREKDYANEDKKYYTRMFLELNFSAMF